MSIEGYVPIILPGFGGEVTLNERGDLPQGVASLAQNLELIPGAMRTRRGMDLYANIPGNLTVRDLAFAYFPDGTQYIFGNTDSGTGYQLMRAESLNFGTHYILATYLAGCRMYFKTYNRLTFAAVRRAGSADAPPAKFSIAGNLASASRGLVLSRMSVHPPQTSAGVNNSATAGNVSAGDHYFLVIFENATGHRTCCMAQPTKLTASGSKKVDVSNLPLGANGNSDGSTFTKDVVKRLIFATSANPALGGNQYPLTGYYCVETVASAMVVADNTTTAVSIDFTDATLVNGTPYTLYADNTPLPPCKGITVYNQRTIAWGVRNALVPAGLSQLQTNPQPMPIPGTFNTPLSFDSGSYSSNPPAGWSVVTGSGGAQTAYAGWFYTPGEPWTMSGNGATLAPGKIRTNADLFLGTTPGKEYRIRFWAGRLLAPSMAPGTLDLHVAGSSVTISVTAAQLAANEGGYFDYKLIDASDVLSVGAFLNVGLNNTPAAGSIVYIGDLMMYPSDAPLYRNTPWVSKAGQPEAFSNLTGFLGIQDADNSQDVQACFVLRSGCFMARETSIFGTQDNGTEPSTWPISKASDIFGACGPMAVALIDDTGAPASGAYGIGGSAGMAVLVSKNGIALFDGATANAISAEIETTLARVNWNYAYLIWATAYSASKKVFIGLPVDGSTVINFGLCLDYHEGWGEPTAAPGSGRKWSEWSVGAMPGLGDFCTLDPADAKVVLCSTQVPGGAQSALVKWPSVNFYDYGTAGNLNIASKYITACLPANSAGEQNFGGLIMNVSGAGNLVVNAVLPDNSLLALPQTGTPRVLALPALHDTYIKANFTTERASIQIQNGANAGDYFAMNQLTVLAKKSPFTPVRGL